MPADFEEGELVLEGDMFVRIDIADQGCGIPEEELTNIWKRFYRGKNAENNSGVGIGLYLTANILNTEGGRVSAKSSPEGSVFSVFLPINGNPQVS